MIFMLNIVMMVSFVIFLSFCFYFLYLLRKHREWIKVVFQTNSFGIFSDTTNKADKLKLKLVQAGITKKEYKQIIYLAGIAGVSVFLLSFLFHLSWLMEILVFIISISIAVFMPMLYVDEQKKARVKKIDNDLAVFIDLLIIILEGGGGLHNAIDTVTTEGAGVIGEDLLEESRRFKQEFITYNSDIAYANLANRTSSEAIATIVGFMKLSEDTGIGVKEIFENQSIEIKEADILGVEKKAALMNIGITLTVFIFILPAIIAIIMFPMIAGVLMKSIT